MTKESNLTNFSWQAPPFRPGTPFQRGLVADDVRASRMIVDRAMFLHGLKAIQAEDGLQAWECLHREQVDVVVTDVEMPRWSGIDLLKRMRCSRDRRIAELPVIVVSSLQDRKLIRFVRQFNFSYYMRKPVSVREMDIMLGLIETSRWLRNCREHDQSPPANQATAKP